MADMDQETPGPQVVLWLAWILLTWYSFMVVLSVLGQVTGQIRYAGKPASPRSSELKDAPGVSILRPLKGVDSELEANLRSSFEQNYSKFEIIFSVAVRNDKAVAIVERLMREYSNVDARLIIGDTPAGVNPKVNNMLQSYREAKYDILWILDSNVIVHADTLGRSVDALQKEGIGLVHHLPTAVRPESYAAEVEQVFLDTNHAKMYLAINAVGIASCVMGKSNLYRRSDLNKVGGLEAFAKYMAEDNIVGEALWSLGLRHAMSADTACQVLGRITPKEYCGRRARWVRLRKYIVTAATLTEPFTESIVCGVMGAIGCHALFQTSIRTFFAIHWLCWCLNDYWLYRTLVFAAPTPVGRHCLSFPSFLRAWLSRELLALPLYLYAMAGTEIAWRHQRYRCISDGTAIPIPSKPSLETISLLGAQAMDDGKAH